MGDQGLSLHVRKAAKEAGRSLDKAGIPLAILASDQHWTSFVPLNGASFVTDDAITAALAEAAREEGFLMCPEGAATYAAYKQGLADGRIGRNERAVLFNCATGLKVSAAAGPSHARPPQADRLRGLVIAW